jgi:Protein of unknown function (DUF2911)
MIIRISISLFCLLSPTFCFGQEKFPDPSPPQSIKQNFGLSTIEISYSRPSARTRKMIGNIEPYDSIWRTGANAPSLITFGSSVNILGNTILPGTYALYTIPSKKRWTVIINKGVKNWGSDHYQKEEDVCRFFIKSESTSTYIETMRFQFENVKPESCLLEITWENWQLAIPITTDVKNTLRAEIEATIKNGTPTYWYAAQFYFEYDANPQKALDMINLAIKTGEERGMKPYWYYHYKARILKQLNRNTDAKEAAQISSRIAIEHGNRNNYVKLNQELINSLK